MEIKKIQSVIDQKFTLYRNEIAHEKQNVMEMQNRYEEMNRYKERRIEKRMDELNYKYRQLATPRHQARKEVQSGVGRFFKNLLSGIKTVGTAVGAAFLSIFL